MNKELDRERKEYKPTAGLSSQSTLGKIMHKQDSGHSIVDNFVKFQNKQDTDTNASTI